MIRPHIDITMYQGYLGKVYPIPAYIEACKRANIQRVTMRMFYKWDKRNIIYNAPSWNGSIMPIPNIGAACSSPYPMAVTETYKQPALSRQRVSQLELVTWCCWWRIVATMPFVSRLRPSKVGNRNFKRHGKKKSRRKAFVMRSCAPLMTSQSLCGGISTSHRKRGCKADWNCNYFFFILIH